MTDIRHIVFDIGNVLVRWDPEAPYRRLIPDAAERARFLAEVCSPAWNTEQDRGRTWSEAEEALIAEHPGHADLIRAFRRHWPEMVPENIAESVAILEALVDAGYDVTGLTNFADDTFDVARGRFPFLDRFRGVTVSGRVRMIKPDPEIYRHHAEAFGLDPAGILFFDDSPRNVAAARAAGWNAELFTSPEELRADLRKHGIAVG